MSNSPSVGRTRGGQEWTPQYVRSIDISHCIGCGRCFKTCPRDVFELVDRESEDDDDDNAKVMSIANPDDCIGCTACANTCPKGCLVHSA